MSTQGPRDRQPGTSAVKSSLDIGGGLGIDYGGGQGPSPDELAAHVLPALEELPLRPNGGVGVQVMGLPEKIVLSGVLVFDGKVLKVSGFKRTHKTAELDQKQLTQFEGKRAQRGRVCDLGFRPDKLG